MVTSSLVCFVDIKIIKNRVLMTKLFAVIKDFWNSILKEHFDSIHQTL